MFKPFEWMVAGRYLRARRAEGFISVIAWFSLIGIGLGVATLIIVMSVMNGFRIELIGKILGTNGHIAVQSYAGRVDNFDDVVARIREMQGVVRVTPVVEGQVLARVGKAAGGAVIRGMRPADLKSHDVLSSKVVAGNVDDLAQPRTIMLGQSLADKYGLTIGDRVELISPTGHSSVMGFVPRIAKYRVVALFSVGMNTYDSSYGFMSLKSAQKFFRKGKGASFVEVAIEDAERAAETGDDILKSIGDGYWIHDWQRRNSSLVTALKVERNVMFIILTLIILVAAFNIISSLIMLVKDKGRDIAILRTMGASRGSVMRIFFIAGTSVGVVGAFLGSVLGILFCTYIKDLQQLLERITGTSLWDPTVRYLTDIPAVMDPVEITLVIVMAFALTILATIYPAWRASRLDPVEALRYE